MNSADQIAVTSEIARKGMLNESILNSSSYGPYGLMWKAISTYNKDTGKFDLMNTRSAREAFLLKYAKANTDWFDELFHAQPPAGAHAEHLDRFRQVAHLRFDRVPSRRRLVGSRRSKPLHAEFPQRLHRQREDLGRRTGRRIVPRPVGSGFLFAQDQLGDGRMVA